MGHIRGHQGTVPAVEQGRGRRGGERTACCTSPYSRRDEAAAGCGRRRVVRPTAAPSPSSPQPPTGCWLLCPATSASASRLPPLPRPQHMGKGPGAAPGAEPGRSSWSGSSLVLPPRAGHLSPGQATAASPGSAWAAHPAQTTQHGPARTSCNGCPVPRETGPARGWVPELSTLRPSPARQEGWRCQQWPANWYPGRSVLMVLVGASIPNPQSCGPAPHLCALWHSLGSPHLPGVGWGSPIPLRGRLGQLCARTRTENHAPT